MAAQTNPASLVTTNHNPYMFDSAHFENLLTQHSERIFVADNELQIKIVEVGNRGKGALTGSNTRKENYQADSVY